MKTNYVQSMLEIVQARLRRYREAENAVLSSQSYSLEGLNLTRADLGKIQTMINELERAELNLLRNVNHDKRSRIRYVIPRDEAKVW